MTTTTTAPTRTQRQARVMRMANIPMRAVLDLPFRTPLSGKLMLVTHTGRVTGRTYRQPVSYVRDGEVLLTPGGGRWTRNLRDGEPVPVRIAGRRAMARPDLVSDAREVEELLGRMLAANPRLASFVPFVERDGTVHGDKLANAVRHGFRIVRWHVEHGASS